MVKTDFDPDSVGADNGNYFGFPFSAEESELVLMSVPWDVTASYGKGSCYAPDAIIGASSQLDFYDPFLPGSWRHGIATLGIDYTIQDSSTLYSEDSRRIMRHLEKGGSVDDDAVRKKLDKINAAHRALNDKVYREASEWLDRGKTVGLVGGDHSVPYGLIRALADRGGIGILHIDAHADLRRAYEGFEFSHASIMYNASLLDGVERIIQVGVRDMSAGEVAYADGCKKITMFTDDSLASQRFAGVAWDEQCDSIVSLLPPEVYISFDIDGLSPDNCPHTGTPVPGGLSFNEAVHLVRKVALSGRTIVGFDLCEVVPSNDSEWDANVGARIIYRLCSAVFRSRGARRGL